jgi:hypothetical protein
VADKPKEPNKTPKSVEKGRIIKKAQVDKAKEQKPKGK